MLPHGLQWMDNMHILLNSLKFSHILCANYPGSTVKKANMRTFVWILANLYGYGLQWHVDSVPWPIYVGGKGSPYYEQYYCEILDIVQIDHIAN